MPIPVAARSKAWVCGRLLAGIAGSNPAGGMSLVSVEFCQLEVSATAAHPYGGILPSVVYLNVIVKPR